MDEFSASASKIKTFHSWYNLKSSYITEADVIDTIKGLKKFKVSFDLGNLVDAYVTDCLDGTDTYLKIRDKVGKDLHIEAKGEITDWVTNFKKDYPIFYTQPEGSITYQTDLGNLKINLRGDILTPNTIFDIKTSKYTLNTATYSSDIQGLIYCDCFDVDTMVYEHFWISHETNKVRYKGCVKQNKVSHDAIKVIMTQFLAFCYKHNIIEYLLPPVVGIDSTFPRGKYKEQPISEMLKSEEAIKYLQWALANTDIIFSEELKKLINDTSKG